MRFHPWRLFLWLIAVFVTVILVLSLHNKSFEYQDEQDGVGDRFPRPMRRRLRGERVLQQFTSTRTMAQNAGPTPFAQKAHGPLRAERYESVQRQIDTVMIRRFDEHLVDLDMETLSRNECKHNETLAEYWKRTRRREVPMRDAWERFYAEIGSCDMYRDETMLDQLLHDLSSRPIKAVSIMDGGTQVKLLISYDNDKMAVFKPMRFGRDYESDPNHFYFSDFERHHAEIATFHLDKVLGFRRAVPTVGRVMNVTGELRDKAEKRLKKTFFVSPAENHCFVSKCDYYCDTTHAICGAPDLKEGSVQVFLPSEENVPRKHNKSPYRRTYSKKNQLAVWQTDMTYCTSKVKTKPLYAHGRRLLDLIDLHILDFLIGNQDRHHYESFSVFDQMPAYAIHLDNGRAFGRTQIDDHDILLPLRQCCIIRPSTLLTLLRYYRGPVSLTEALHSSMSKDQVAPILAQKHYPAIERRLKKILDYVLQCLDAHSDSVESVVLNEYHNPNTVEEINPPEETEEDEENNKENNKEDNKENNKKDNKKKP